MKKIFDHKKNFFIVKQERSLRYFFKVISFRIIHPLPLVSVMTSLIMNYRGKQQAGVCGSLESSRKSPMSFLMCLEPG